MKTIFKLLLLTTLLIQASAFASEGCAMDHMAYLENTKGEFIGDSHNYKLNSEDLDFDFIEQPEQFAKQAVSKLSRNVAKRAGYACSSKITKVTCKNIIPKSASTLICHVETNDGYFFVSMDMLTTVHIIFNRWD